MIVICLLIKAVEWELVHKTREESIAGVLSQLVTNGTNSPKIKDHHKNFLQDFFDWIGIANYLGLAQKFRRWLTEDK